MSPKELLKQGNLRYLNKEKRHVNMTSQNPIATVLGCSDSRVPVEVIFDMGIGDLFVIRNAGNIVDTDVAGTIEYGVDHLHTPLLVVLGHTGCGACTSALVESPVSKNLEPVISKIKKVKNNIISNNGDLNLFDLIDKVVDANIWNSIKTLLEISPLIKEQVKSKKLEILGAKYDLKTGEVLWMGEHPEMDALLK